MIIKKICILGGTGFVGRNLANQLSYEGYEVIIPTRNRELNREDLILLPKLQLVEADIHNPESLAACLEGCDVVINLVGILNETGPKGKEYRHVHVGLTSKLIDACKKQGVTRLLQMSSLNAAPNAGSLYLKTKGEAEDLAHGAAGLKVSSYRPSVIFGRNDSFFNRFAFLLKLSPVVFPLACAGSRFAPVYVSDVTELLLKTMKDPGSYGARLEVAGPDVYSLRELVQYTADCLGLRRKIIPLPDFVSRLVGMYMDLWGFMFRLLILEKPFSLDNYLSMQTDSTTEDNSLPRYGIEPTGIEAIVPGYLANRTYKSRYKAYRESSHRTP